MRSVRVHKDRQQSMLHRERGVTGFDGMLSFSACDLWPFIRGRTLWIMGDSHSYDLFHSVACLLLPVRIIKQLLALPPAMPNIGEISPNVLCLTQFQVQVRLWHISCGKDHQEPIQEIQLEGAACDLCSCGTMTSKEPCHMLTRRRPSSTWRSMWSITSLQSAYLSWR